MLDNVGLRYPHRASGTKAPRTLRPLPLLRFAVSATGGAHLCSTKYYLRFWLSSYRTSLVVSALRIMQYCLSIYYNEECVRYVTICGKTFFHRFHRRETSRFFKQKSIFPQLLVRFSTVSTRFSTIPPWKTVQNRGKLCRNCLKLMVVKITPSGFRPVGRQIFLNFKSSSYSVHFFGSF